MSDRDEGAEKGAYGHPDADWTDDDGSGGEARKGDGERHRDGAEDDEDDEDEEPPDAALLAGPEPLTTAWSQAQQRYPAQERPRDLADERRAATPHPEDAPMAHDDPTRDRATHEGREPGATPDDPPGKLPEPDATSGDHPEKLPEPDATTGDEGGGTEAGLRDEEGPGKPRPQRKSPARERRRAG